MTDHQHQSRDKGFAARLWQSILATSEAAVDIHYRAPWQRATSAPRPSADAIGNRCTA